MDCGELEVGLNKYEAIGKDMKIVNLIMVAFQEYSGNPRIHEGRQNPPNYKNNILKKKKKKLLIKVWIK